MGLHSCQLLGLLVFKNGLKKCSSFKNYWVIDVWSWCKKRDGGGEEKGTKLGFGVLMAGSLGPCLVN